MRTLYLDCGMGAAGDMLTAALLELHPNSAAFIDRLNSLGFPDVVISAEKTAKCGIAGTHFSVKVHGIEEDEHLHSHPHYCHGGLAQIRSVVNSLPIPAMVKLNITAVFEELAEAESLVHGVPMEQIHFHEVGSMDAIVDITAFCLLMHELAVDRVVVSPIHVGSGSVRCAHGVLPVPAPATAQLLKDVPIYGSSIQGELCTPTGAALLKHFADDFGDMPTMRVQKIGYGMGKKDFPRANCVRAMLSEAAETPETVLELSCNVDDMTGEEIGFALEQFMAQGALDVFTTSIGMKKSRPGTLITVICRESEKGKWVQLIFKHTTTLGIREKHCIRYTLERRIETEETVCGTIRKKVSTGYGIRREKWEYEDLARIAKEQNVGIEEVRSRISKK